MDDKGERIPLTICDYDREAGTITIVFQPVGASTTKMKELKAGDYFRDFTGPLGNASELVEEDIEELKKKKILFVGGGVGAAPVYPQVKWLHEHGVDADVIIGSKTKDMLILEKEMEAVSGNYYPCTDDGSYGHAGMVTTMVEELVVKKVNKIRRMYRDRSNDHDEIRMSSYKETGNPYCCKYEPDHGRWNRYVRSLSSACRR